MSIKTTLAAINAMPHVKASYSNYMGSREIRVTLRGLSREEEENCAYYTCDQSDAIGTAQAMSQREATWSRGK